MSFYGYYCIRCERFVMFGSKQTCSRSPDGGGHEGLPIGDWVPGADA